MKYAIFGFGSTQGFSSRFRESAEVAFAKGVLTALLDGVKISPKEIVVFADDDFSDELHDFLERGGQFVELELEEEGALRAISKHLSRGDVVLNFSYAFDTVELTHWCSDRYLHLVSPSCQRLGGDDEIPTTKSESIFEDYRNFASEFLEDSLQKKQTSLLGFGLAPGLISQFCLKGILDVATFVLENDSEYEVDSEQLQQALDERDFAGTSQLLKLKRIHLNEVDSCVGSSEVIPDNLHVVDSAEGFFDTVFSPVELVVGKHEKIRPQNLQRIHGEKSPASVLPIQPTRCWARSWVPGGEFFGYLHRSDELATLLHFFQSKGAGDDVPTLLRITRPASETLKSLEHLGERGFLPQERVKIIGPELSSGASSVGAVLIGANMPTWWCGSTFSVKESRQVLSDLSPSIVQATCGVLAALEHIKEQPKLGVCFPESLPLETTMKTLDKYLGEIRSEPVTELGQASKLSLKDFFLSPLEWEEV